MALPRAKEGEGVNTVAADPAATAAAALEMVERTSALFVSAGENDVKPVRICREELGRVVTEGGRIRAGDNCEAAHIK